MARGWLLPAPSCASCTPGALATIETLSGEDAARELGEVEKVARKNSPRLTSLPRAARFRANVNTMATRFAAGVWSGW